MGTAILDLLKRLFTSTKVMAAMAAALLVWAQRLGLPIDEETLHLLLGIIGAWIVSQGIADVGKPAAQLQIDAVGAVQQAQVTVARLEAEQAVTAAKKPAARKRVRKGKS